MLPKLDENGSRLGTKDYWDHHYSREIANFEETGDDGEVWFGEKSEQGVLKFILSNIPNYQESNILELGCGNASLLRKLWAKGYVNLVGIDYSENALELSRKACEKLEDFADTSDPSASKMPEFHLVDLTADDSLESLSNLVARFHCIIDKGTWDAISLAPGDMKEKQSRLQNYRRAVIGFARKTEECPYFIIVSCNFTRKELVEMFECDELKFFAELPTTSSFTFGGNTGSTFTSIVFRIQKSI